jgi:hypothetical protein
MRDNIFKNEDYFNSFKKVKLDIIKESFGLIQNELDADKIPFAKYRVFLFSLEILISNYSKGTEISELKNDFSFSINYLKEGWDDSVVKFKSGNKLLDQYRLNEYCYIVWLISFAILLDVPKQEKSILLDTILKANIQDELILFLLKYIEDENTLRSSKLTTYKPFKSLLKADILKTDSNQIKKYLDKWYQNTKLLTWHNYSPNSGKYFYYGKWSFESAVIVAILDLDDSKFRDNEYYPKDLVDYYRANQPV